MTAFKNHGKALSSRGKPKLSERDRRILKGIVSKNHRTAAAKVTAELNIHLEDPVSTVTVRRELHKSTVELQLLSL
jgi:hypothetical protein